MKPPPFAYEAPSSLDAALTRLAEFTAGEEDVKLLAGGQSLVPLLNMRLSEPHVLIDLNGLERELGGIRIDGRELCLGALVRHRQLEEDPLVRTRLTVLSELEHLVGHVAIRTRGTVGGSLAHADPSAELPLAAVALQAELVLKSVRGERRVKAEDFFVTYFTTDLAPDEVLTEVRFPLPDGRTGQAIEEYARRHGDFAVVAALAVTTLDEEGALVSGRLALAGVGSTAEDMSSHLRPLFGRPISQAALTQVGDAVYSELEPDGDLHASSAYRKELARVLSERALARALKRASGGASAWDGSTTS